MAHFCPPFQQTGVADPMKDRRPIDSAGIHYPMSRLTTGRALDPTTDRLLVSRFRIDNFILDETGRRIDLARQSALMQVVLFGKRHLTLADAKTRVLITGQTGKAKPPGPAGC